MNNDDPSPIEIAPDTRELNRASRAERADALWRIAWIINTLAVVAAVVTFQLFKRATWEQETQIAAVGYSAAAIFWIWSFVLTLRAAKLRSPSEAAGSIWAIEIIVGAAYVWPTLPF